MRLRRPNDFPGLFAQGASIFAGVAYWPLASILAQRGLEKEIIGVDGASTDGTVEILRQNNTEIDYWISAPDGGPYDAMNRAATLATGRYIIFMNAGDCFQTPDTLASALQSVEGDPDIIYGHHIYRRVDGCDETHLASDFSDTCSILARGQVTWEWLKGIPGHQATLTKTEVLRREQRRPRWAYGQAITPILAERTQSHAIAGCGTRMIPYAGSRANPTKAQLLSVNLHAGDVGRRVDWTCSIEIVREFER